LQSGDEQCRKAWKIFCDLSRKEFSKIYKRLGVRLVEKGESFYNPMIPKIIKMAEDKGIVKIDQGAKCIFIPKTK